MFKKVKNYYSSGNALDHAILEKKFGDLNQTDLFNAALAYTHFCVPAQKVFASKFNELKMNQFDFTSDEATHLLPTFGPWCKVITISDLFCPEFRRQVAETLPK